MTQIIGTIVAALLMIVLAFPFGQDIYQNYLVRQRLGTIMNPAERAEYRDWKGDASSFAKRLYDRCELSQGQGAVQCDRYRYALQ